MTDKELEDKEIAALAAKHATKYNQTHSGDWMTAFNSFIMGCKEMIKKRENKDIIGKLDEGWAIRKK